MRSNHTLLVFLSIFIITTLYQLITPSTAQTFIHNGEQNGRFIINTTTPTTSFKINFDFYIPTDLTPKHGDFDITWCSLIPISNNNTIPIEKDFDFETIIINDITYNKYYVTVIPYTDIAFTMIECQWVVIIPVPYTVSVQQLITTNVIGENNQIDDDIYGGQNVIHHENGSIIEMVAFGDDMNQNTFQITQSTPIWSEVTDLNKATGIASYIITTHRHQRISMFHSQCEITFTNLQFMSDSTLTRMIQFEISSNEIPLHTLFDIQLLSLNGTIMNNNDIENGEYCHSLSEITDSIQIRCDKSLPINVNIIIVTIGLNIAEDFVLDQNTLITKYHIYTPESNYLTPFPGEATYFTHRMDLHPNGSQRTKIQSFEAKFNEFQSPLAPLFQQLIDDGDNTIQLPIMEYNITYWTVPKTILRFNNIVFQHQMPYDFYIFQCNNSKHLALDYTHMNSTFYSGQQQVYLEEIIINADNTNIDPTKPIFKPFNETVTDYNITCSFIYNPFLPQLNTIMNQHQNDFYNYNKPSNYINLLPTPHYYSKLHWESPSPLQPIFNPSSLLTTTIDSSQFFQIKIEPLHYGIQFPSKRRRTITNLLTIAINGGFKPNSILEISLQIYKTHLIGFQPTFSSMIKPLESRCIRINHPTVLSTQIDTTVSEIYDIYTYSIDIANMIHPELIFTIESTIQTTCNYNTLNVVLLTPDVCNEFNDDIIIGQPWSQSQLQPNGDIYYIEIDNQYHIKQEFPSKPDITITLNYVNTKTIKKVNIYPRPPPPRHGGNIKVLNRLS